MACRKIKPSKTSNDYIIKYIDYGWPRGLHFPNPEDLNWYELEDIYTKFNLDKITQQAITQQYNELFIFDEADREQRNILAPQVRVKFDPFTNLPEIMYPKFTPLVQESMVWSLNEQNLNVCLGMSLRECYVNMSDYQKFCDKVRNLCDDFNIKEDDILLNPSNIGYHSALGLRIIDYGLTDDSDLVVR